MRRGEKKCERRVPNLTSLSEERRKSMTLVNFMCCVGVHNRSDPDGARRRIKKGDLRVGQNVGKRVKKNNLESQKNWKGQSLPNKQNFTPILEDSQALSREGEEEGGELGMCEVWCGDRGWWRGCEYSVDRRCVGNEEIMNRKRR
jgi:hypothetical protein